LIRYGPAGAPRWFNQDVALLDHYLDLIALDGGSAIEFVVLPGPGTEELGRVHLLGPIAPLAIARAQAKGLIVNLHAPLTPEFRVAEWARDRSSYREQFSALIDLLRVTESGQPEPPTLVIHAAAGRPDQTADYLEWLAGALSGAHSAARIAVELRGPAKGTSRQFDRSLETLAAFVDTLGDDRIGICWDVAHDWENGAGIAELDSGLLRCINHVHIHDNRPTGEVHAPLGTGAVPWRDALRQLNEAQWSGSVTLEIRYRYARELGDPWDILRASLQAARAVLAGE
jgi:sugar phosphate isomerase/epimerase